MELETISAFNLWVYPLDLCYSMLSNQGHSVHCPTDLCDTKRLTGVGEVSDIINNT